MTVLPTPQQSAERIMKAISARQEEQRLHAEDQQIQRDQFLKRRNEMIRKVTAQVLDELAGLRADLQELVYRKQLMRQAAEDALRHTEEQRRAATLRAEHEATEKARRDEESKHEYRLMAEAWKAAGIAGPGAAVVTVNLREEWEDGTETVTEIEPDEEGAGA